MSAPALLSYADALDMARQATGLTDAAARTLCSAWASPGGVGHTLAAIATGAWSLPLSPDQLAEFGDDLDKTFGGGVESAILRDVLGVWASEGSEVGP